MCLRSTKAFLLGHKVQIATTVWAALILASANSCDRPLHTQETRDGSAAQRDTASQADWSTQWDQKEAALVHDTAATEDRQREPTDTLMAETSSPQCVHQTLDSSTFPVTGTVHGTKVEALVCDHGVETYLLGPSGTDTSCMQNFDTSSPYGAGWSDSYAGYGFLLSAPADAISATFSGGVGTAAPAVGSYDSTRSCGWLKFDVTLPIPPGVVCPAEVGNCGPDCKGEGEMGICMPANAMLHYIARSSATCASNLDPPSGSWNLTIKSVSPATVPSGYYQFDTHGHLSATLMNSSDLSDSVVLSLDF
jgi:hypothetical protein